MAGELNPTAAAMNYPAAAAAVAASTAADKNNNLGPKRQRRPSVRLGEIGGDKPSTNTGFRQKPSSYKTRPLTNLVMNKDEFEFDDDIDKPAKRPLTNFSINTTTNNNNNNNEEDDEEVGGQDEDDEQQQHQLSPDSGESADERVFQVWHAHNRRSTRPINNTTTNNINNNNNDGISGGGFRGLDIGVRNWLIDLGLARYAPVFEIHEVDDDVLPLLTLDDLKDMGINAVGSRRKLYAAILNLRKGLS